MRKFNKGQTLVEVIMSMGVAVIVIVALVILATSALRNAQESLRKSESGKLANAGVEAAIYFKNVWGFDQLPSGNYQLLGSESGTVLQPSAEWINVSTPSGLTYRRNISITNASGTMTIISTVAWDDTQGEKQTQVQRVVTDWK